MVNIIDHLQRQGDIKVSNVSIQLEDVVVGCRLHRQRDVDHRKRAFDKEPVLPPDV